MSEKSLVRDEEDIDYQHYRADDQRYIRYVEDEREYLFAVYLYDDVNEIADVNRDYSVDKIADRSAHYKHERRIYPFSAMFRFEHIDNNADKYDKRRDYEHDIFNLREIAYYIPADPEKDAWPIPKMMNDGQIIARCEDVLVDDRGYIYMTDSNGGLSVLRCLV